MAARKPLVIINGQVQQLQPGDSLEGGGGGGSSGSGLDQVRYNIFGKLIVMTGVMRWYPDSDITISSCYFSIGVVDTSLVEIDVKKNGTSIFTEKPSVAVGEYKSSVKTVSIPMTVDDYLTCDVTQSSNARDAVVSIVYTRD